MTRLVFEKYSSFGNHFVLVEETTSVPWVQAQREELARRAANVAFGVGADSVIFLKALTEAGRWLARFFEPSGKEFLTCGNGLACVARHLYDYHGQGHAEVLVEWPTQRPRACAVTWQATTQIASVRLAPDLSCIRSFVHPSFAACAQEGILLFSAKHLTSQANTLVASGALVYTGEPHMVVIQLPNGVVPPIWPTSVPWVMDLRDLFDEDIAAIERAGLHLNRGLRESFPQGINLILARPVGRDTFEYRCFERGLESQTLACGTGALALGMVARELGLAGPGPLRVLPAAARALAHFASAELGAHFHDDGSMTLATRAEHVFSGVFSAALTEF